MSYRFRVCFGAVAAVGGLLALQALQADVASAGTIEQKITAQMVVKTAPVGSGCGGSLFAVVKDLPDAAEYRVTVARTDLPGQDGVVVFNRHDRGQLQFTPFAKWSPGAGKIAGLLTWGSGDGPGDDCAAVTADYASRFSIKDARVVRYTADPPRAGRAAVEVRTAATPPANDGPSGKDGCAMNLFVTVPKVKGAVRYRVRVTQTIVGVLGTSDIVIEPGKLNAKGPAGTKLQPYRSPSRLGHFYLFLQRDLYGCRHAEWWLSRQIKNVTFRVERA
jgi:hypothetical protein